MHIFGFGGLKNNIQPLTFHINQIPFESHTFLNSYETYQNRFQREK